MFIIIEELIDIDTTTVEAREINKVNAFRMHLINELPLSIEGEQDDHRPYNTDLNFIDPVASVNTEIQRLTDQKDDLKVKMS